jgi:hypothetical protein
MRRREQSQVIVPRCVCILIELSDAHRRIEVSPPPAGRFAHDWSSSRFSQRRHTREKKPSLQDKSKLSVGYHALTKSHTPPRRYHATNRREKERTREEPPRRRTREGDYVSTLMAHSTPAGQRLPTPICSDPWTRPTGRCLDTPGSQHKPRASSTHLITSQLTSATTSQQASERAQLRVRRGGMGDGKWVMMSEEEKMGLGLTGTQVRLIHVSTPITSPTHDQHSRMIAHKAHGIEREEPREDTMRQVCLYHRYPRHHACYLAHHASART